MTRAAAYPILAVAAGGPRLGALLYEKSDVTNAFVDKGDDFARTFLASGTYGFIPDIPSAYTQPLYGFFLVPIYWAVERSWWTVGTAQIVVAILTAWLVFEIGARVISPAGGLLASLIATLHPYLVWHDVHMNREILDELLAAAIVLLTLVLAERQTPLLACALGLALGISILGNVRLLGLPIVIAFYLLWRGRADAVGPVIVAVGTAVLVVTPWVLRNEVSVGCLAITTDGRALWKANNVNTLETLRAGKWIDDVPRIPGTPLTPQDAGAIYERSGRIVRTDECAQMRFYRELALDFMQEHPREKAELAVLAARMLWQPAVTKTEGRPGAGTWLDTGRTWIEPLFMVALFGVAIAGFFFAPRGFVVLALALLAYQTAAAMLFAGETRYRVPWDFLTAVLASATVLAVARRLAARRSETAVQPPAQ